MNQKLRVSAILFLGVLSSTLAVAQTSQLTSLVKSIVGVLKFEPRASVRPIYVARSESDNYVRSALWTEVRYSGSRVAKLISHNTFKGENLTQTSLLVIIPLNKSQIEIAKKGMGYVAWTKNMEMLEQTGLVSLGKQVLEDLTRNSRVAKLVTTEHMGLLKHHASRGELTALEKTGIYVEQMDRKIIDVATEKSLSTNLQTLRVGDEWVGALQLNVSIGNNTSVEQVSRFVEAAMDAVNHSVYLLK